MRAFDEKAIAGHLCVEYGKYGFGTVGAFAGLGGKLRRSGLFHGHLYRCDHHHRKPRRQSWLCVHGFSCTVQRGGRSDTRSGCDRTSGSCRRHQSLCRTSDRGVQYQSDRARPGRANSCAWRLLFQLIGWLDRTADAEWQRRLRFQDREHADDGEQFLCCPDERRAVWQCVLADRQLCNAWHRYNLRRKPDGPHQ